ncbi:GNAT family N-acetyltransferase [Halalkalibacillus sediminis]|uniref:GNAT family N-acetyltransferase n=1 Tax=Halalkalibacillus sediminis TaxID=2018042 RepID=A0A2I0QV77_9BACI|nr:GNAT family N-acetyltransferase [Halalkalibacillus sediminis]PKR78252.1 GNAT family N-acetyltransferase [Halalkalibacillus sediminis]
MVTVRKARLEDAEHIAEVHDKTWRSTYEPIIKEADLQQVKSFQTRKIMWETALQSSKINQDVFVAVNENDEVLGFISGGKERTENFDYEGEIYDIYILEQYQGEGVGRLLLKAFVDSCEENGYTSLLVWILTKNPAGRFYTRHGAAKVEAENVTIGEGTYEETAYGWKDLNELKHNLSN